MAKKRLERREFPKDLLSDEDWEAIETVSAMVLLMDKTPAEILEAAYDGPEQSVERYLDTW